MCTLWCVPYDVYLMMCILTRNLWHAGPDVGDLSGTHPRSSRAAGRGRQRRAALLWRLPGRRPRLPTGTDSGEQPGGTISPASFDNKPDHILSVILYCILCDWLLNVWRAGISLADALWWFSALYYWKNSNSISIKIIVCSQNQWMVGKTHLVM